MSLSQHFCDHSWNSASRFGLHDREDEFFTEASSVEGDQDGWGLEHLPCEGKKAEETELFQPGEEGTTYRKAFPSHNPLKGKIKR